MSNRDIIADRVAYEVPNGRASLRPGIGYCCSHCCPRKTSDNGTRLCSKSCLCYITTHKRTIHTVSRCSPHSISDSITNENTDTITLSSANSVAVCVTHGATHCHARFDTNKPTH